jgi:hypothetical protein
MLAGKYLLNEDLPRKGTVNQGKMSIPINNNFELFNIPPPLFRMCTNPQIHPYIYAILSFQPAAIHFVKMLSISCNRKKGQPIRLN